MTKKTAVIASAAAATATPTASSQRRCSDCHSADMVGVEDRPGGSWDVLSPCDAFHACRSWLSPALSIGPFLAVPFVSTGFIGASPREIDHLLPGLLEGCPLKAGS